MKLSIVLLIVVSLQVSLNLCAQTKSFDLAMSDATVKEVLRTIEQQSEFRFFYNDELSDINQLVTINFQNLNIEPDSDHFNLGYGVVIYGEDETWVPDPQFGSGNFIFIEDNTFIEHRHSVACGGTGRYVFRNNHVNTVSSGKGVFFIPVS